MKLGLTCERTERLQVVVANDNKIKSPGQSRDVPIAMGNQLILIDFYILTLNGVDVVLGVNWLQMLSPILCNLKAKTMIFKQNGRVMELHGIESTHSTPIAQLHTTNIES